MRTLTPSDILDRAATVIERNGWHQKDHARPIDGSTPRTWPVCASGAINVAAGLLPNGLHPISPVPSQAQAAREARTLLRDWVGCDIPTWNDEPDRTEQQVTAALRAAAGEARAAR